MKTVRQKRDTLRGKSGRRAPASEPRRPVKATPRLHDDGLETRVALHPFLAGMSSAHLALLADGARVVYFRKGQTILHAEEFADGFYLIESGSVALGPRASPGGFEVMTQLGPGDLLGCSWMFPPYVWRFTARATAPVCALRFCGSVLRKLCEKEPALGYALLKRAAAVMLHRMQTARERMWAAGI